MRGGRLAGPAGAALALVAAACTPAGPGPGPGPGPAERTLTVLAAASLTETFEELAEKFEAEHSGVTVRLVLDSSATLAEQVTQGAPGDVLATADERTMQVVLEAGTAAGDPEPFATNRLVLAVPADNPAGVDALADLDDPQVDYVACVASAPCGALARRVLDRAGITSPPVSEEVDVKAVLAKVMLGEVDAGLVYATDVVAAGDDVAAVRLPSSAEQVARYPVVVLAEAREPRLAAAWVDLVTSAAGRRVLADAGFGAP